MMAKHRTKLFLVLAASAALLVGALIEEGGDDTTCLLQAAVKVVPLLAAEEPALAVFNASNASILQVAAVKQADEEHGERDTLQSATFIWNRSMLAFFAFLAVYAVIAVAYEMQFDGGQGENAKARVLEWDAVKLFVQVIVVAMHVHVFVLLNLRPRDENSSGIRLGNLGVLAAHGTNFNEWIVFFHSSVFRMPCFAVISGVFGQKVDKVTMLRVCCYTYGTVFMIYFLQLFINLVTLDHVRAGHNAALWYLVCLFFWRVTLSPCFDKLKDSSLNVRVAALILVVFLCYGLYDLVGGRIDAIKEEYWYFPSSEYFALGPFFAFGLLAPSREFTKLLINRKLQVAGSLTIVAMYCAAAWAPSYRSFLEANKPALEGHWILPDGARAFQPLRLGEHVFWMLYRAVAVFSVMWFVAGFTSTVCALAPDVGQRLLSGGARTMYSYALHVPLMWVATDMCGAGGAVREMKMREWCLWAHVLGVIVVLLLTARLTEKLLHHIVMPFWILDVLGFLGLVSDGKPATEKAVLGAEKLKMATTGA
eukprot:TRINITY_DN31296_c0_g1_i1.p1 TRINITY_DN31296_c0_g1~~TRINITY_DN31296_c0_g1_i1.p1  ORF type:complete len:536 (-),score=106.52 TRINITY_DN31296_c0_g1_i1:118-1725(-)